MPLEPIQKLSGTITPFSRKVDPLKGYAALETVVIIGFEESGQACSAYTARGISGSFAG
jgi:hypothetical protein